MNRIFSLIIICIILLSSSDAKTVKELKRNFSIEPGYRLVLDNFNFSELKIMLWDKNEVGFDLKATVICSDKEYEKLFVDSLKILNELSNLKQVISLKYTKEKAGFNFLGLFTIRASYTFNLRIEGIVYIPPTGKTELNAFSSDIYISDMKGIPDIKGSSNNIYLNNCTDIKDIDNDFGTMKLTDCQGDLKIASTSGKIEVNNFIGNIAADVNFAKLRLYDVKGYLDIKTSSGYIDISNAWVRSLECPFSEIELKNISLKDDEQIKISGNSIVLFLLDCKTDIDIKGSFSKIRMNNLTGNFNYNGNSASISADEVEGNLFINTSFSGVRFKKLLSDEIRIGEGNNEINLSLTDLPQIIDIENTFKNVVVNIPGNYDGGIKLSSKFGKIYSDFKFDIFEESGTKSYKLRNGKNVKRNIYIENSNGNIELNSYRP